MTRKLVSLVLALVVALCVCQTALADQGFTFDYSIRTVQAGGTLQLTLVRTGGAQDEGTIVYGTTDEKKAVVDQNGLVTGVSAGQVRITAQLTTEKKVYNTYITLTVEQPVTEITVKEDKLVVAAMGDADIANLTDADMAWAAAAGLEPEDAAALPVLVLRAGYQVEMSASCLPKDAANRRWKMVSDNPDVVRVDSTVLTPRNPGECLLTVESRSNPEVNKRYHVLVLRSVKSVKVTNPDKYIFLGETAQLSAECSPEDASIKSVTWTSQNEKVATVDENGVVTGVSKGSAVIRATATDGSKRYGEVTVRVYQQPESITFKEYDLTIAVGTNKTLYPTVNPSNTSKKEVVYETSDESIAKVNAYGRITPVAPGACTITCRSESYPSVFTTVNVNVVQLATKVTFMEKTATVDVGSTAQLFWTVSPENVTDPTVLLSSNNEKVAVVDQDGTIHGLKRGECTITATAQDGSKKRGTIKVKVLQPVQGVHMQKDSYSVGVQEYVRLTAVMEPEDASNTNMTWYSDDQRIATVSGKNNRPTVEGQAWGTTVIHGTTEDGGYTTSATVQVGNYDKAIKLTDLYLRDNQIRIVALNESNMVVTRFYFTIECFDLYDRPLPCTTDGQNIFSGSYRYTLYEGDSTSHGRFSFSDFMQPEEDIGRVVMYITGYRCEDGYSRNIREDKQPTLEYKSDKFIGAEPTVDPNYPELITPAPEG